MPKRKRPDRDGLLELAESAWRVRDSAFILGDTKVGCALLTAEGLVFVGCNMEHRYRCHDVHAEVNAISSMVAGGGRSISALVVAAERKRFTPCGSCMDWILQFSAPGCVVGYQARRRGRLVVHQATELMPFYPH